MDIISLILSGLALLVSAWSAYRANKGAEESNRKSEKANEIAQGANELAQSANVYASEANMLSRQGVEVSQRTFENQYLPKITFRYGASGDLTTNPPIESVLIRAANEGYIPILIDWIGFSIVGSQTTVSVFTVDQIQGRQSLLPAEILPGRVLDIPIDPDSLRRNLQLNAKAPEDEFVFRLVQQTGQWFETDQLKVKDYIGDELPVQVRFHNSPSSPDDESQQGGD